MVERRRGLAQDGSVTPRVHILTQYLWPDDAPTGIYAEQVADALASTTGLDVQLVGGSGCYRRGRRRAPRAPIVRLAHWQGERGRLLSTALEYGAVHRAFSSYLRFHVGERDVVVVTSAPPSTVFLHESVRRRGAVGVYWLQDYYPQLIRGLREPPRAVAWLHDKAWQHALASWDYVVKAAGNLAYEGGNARVIRNWNTVDPGEPRPAVARTALYSGNLGYGHDLGAFLRMCEQLRDDGYELTVRGDGPGMRHLPSWVKGSPPLAEPAELVASYWRAEVHLIAASPKLTGAIFPSKLWNSLAVGRPVRASGFAGPMATELDAARRADFRAHLDSWVGFLSDVANTGRTVH